MPHVWKRKRRKKTPEEEKEGSGKKLRLGDETESGMDGEAGKDVDIDSEEDGIKLNLGKLPSSDDCLTDEEVNRFNRDEFCICCTLQNKKQQKCRLFFY